MGAEFIAEIGTAVALSLTPGETPVQHDLIPQPHVQVLSAKEAHAHMVAPDVFAGPVDLTILEGSEPPPDDLDLLLESEFKPTSLIPVEPRNYGFRKSGLSYIGVGNSRWAIDVLDLQAPDGRTYSRMVSIDLSSGPANSEISPEIERLFGGEAEVDDLVRILAHFSPLGKNPDLIYTTGHTFYQGMPERGYRLEYLYASDWLQDNPNNGSFYISIEDGRANFRINPVSDFEPRDNSDYEGPWSFTIVPEKIQPDDPRTKSVQETLDSLIRGNIGRTRFESLKRGISTPLGSTSTELIGEINRGLQIQVDSQADIDNYPGKFWSATIFPQMIYPGISLTSALDRLVFTEGTVDNMVGWADEVVNMPGEAIGREWMLLTYSKDGATRQTAMTNIDLGGGKQAIVQVYYDTFQNLPEGLPENFPMWGFPEIDLQFAFPK